MSYSDRPLSAETNVYAQRLLSVVRACREDPDPENFTMRRFTNCGTPACALGHYASRSDLQQEFYLRRADGLIGIRKRRHLRGQGIDSPILQQHFGLSYSQMEELFGMGGCDGARTPNEAATYIETFVKAEYQVSIDG